MRKSIYSLGVISIAVLLFPPWNIAWVFVQTGVEAFSPRFSGFHFLGARPSPPNQEVISEGPNFYSKDPTKAVVSISKKIMGIEVLVLFCLWVSALLFKKMRSHNQRLRATSAVGGRG